MARDDEALRDERRQLERDERRLACEEALFLRDAAYGRHITEMERRVEAQGAAICLEDVPPGEIVGLMQQELQNRSNPYPPKAPDLLRRWKAEEWAEDEHGRTERVVLPNGGGRNTLEPTPNELAMRNALPSAADGVCRCSTCESIRRRFKSGATKQSRAPLPERATPRDDTLLGRALDDWGGMAVWKVARELWTAFGWWLLNRTPVAQWTPDLVKAAWAEWQQERLAEQGDSPEEVPDGAAHA